MVDIGTSSDNSTINAKLIKVYLLSFNNQWTKYLHTSREQFNDNKMLFSYHRYDTISYHSVSSGLSLRYLGQWTLLLCFKGNHFDINLLFTVHEVQLKVLINTIQAGFPTYKRIIFPLPTLSLSFTHIHLMRFLSAKYFVLLIQISIAITLEC